MRYEFTETHEHPEGGDRGGFAPETHSFSFENGEAVHDYDLDCNDGGPGSFGLDEMTLQRLTTREDAIGFVKEEVRAAKAKLEEAEECLQKLMEATTYKDNADYFGYEEDEEDMEDDEEDEE